MGVLDTESEPNGILEPLRGVVRHDRVARISQDRLWGIIFVRVGKRINTFSRCRMMSCLEPVALTEGRTTMQNHGDHG